MSRHVDRQTDRNRTRRAEKGNREERATHSATTAGNTWERRRRAGVVSSSFIYIPDCAMVANDDVR